MMEIVGDSPVDAVEAFLQHYEGYAKTKRLKFLAECCPEWGDVAKRLLVRHLKQGCNANLYFNVTKSLAGSSDPELFCDEQWVKSTERQLANKFDVLESELTQAKSAMVKESIRLAQRAIGRLHYDIGNLNEAMKFFLKCKDFLTKPAHHAEMYLDLISVSLDLDQFFNASNFISKVADASASTITQSKLKAASGLVALHGGNFYEAAKHFMEVDPELENHFCNVISAEDIAFYGGLCALASFKRNDMKKLVVEKKNFINNFLILIPPLRSLCIDFYNGSYGSCIKTLESMKARMAMDLFLRYQAETLTKRIFEQLILQYSTPYDVLDIVKMAHVFDTDDTTIETSVAHLIADGKLSAKIDLVNKRVLRSQRNKRMDLLVKVTESIEKHLSDVKRDIFRLSLAENAFVIDGAEDQLSFAVKRRHAESGIDASDNEDDDADVGKRATASSSQGKEENMEVVNPEVTNTTEDEGDDDAEDMQ